MVVVPAPRRRTWLLIGLALVVLAGLASAAIVVLRDESSPGFLQERARHFDLAGGEAQIAVSYSPEGDLVVRWRDRDRATWTDPEVVYEADGKVNLMTRIRVGGPTLALVTRYTPSATYYSDEPTSDMEADDVVAFVVCRDGSCTASEEYPAREDRPPQVTPDGEHALLGEVDGTFVTWQGGAIEARPATGLPGIADEAVWCWRLTGRCAPYAAWPTSRGACSRC